MTTGFRILSQVVFLVLLLALTGCLTPWSKAIQYGSAPHPPFTATVDITQENGLLVVPVQIGDSTYRFIVDTGATNSISVRLQNNLKYKKISQGKMRDSQGNRQSVPYVKVDSLSIGGISFYNQTMFVANFNANPVLKCMNLDGIIGGNLLRLCNWTIDYQANKITFTNQPIPPPTGPHAEIAFKAEADYDMRVDVKVGNATVTNMLFDTGSNGGLSVPSDVFTKLINRGVFDSIYHYEAIKQSGLYGQLTKGDRRFTYADSTGWKEHFGKQVYITHGKGLLGNDLLSNFRTTINWYHQKIYLEPTQTPSIPLSTFGISLGYTPKSGVILLGVQEGSAAHAAGLKPLMQVLQYDTLVFNQTATYCDYLAQRGTIAEKPELLLRVRDSLNRPQTYSLERITLK